MVQSLGRDQDDLAESSSEQTPPIRYQDEIIPRYLTRRELSRVTKNSAEKSPMWIVSAKSVRVILSQFANLHFTDFLLLIFLLFLFSIILNIIYYF